MGDVAFRPRAADLQTRPPHHLFFATRRTLWDVVKEPCEHRRHSLLFQTETPRGSPLWGIRPVRRCVSTRIPDTHCTRSFSLKKAPVPPEAPRLDPGRFPVERRDGMAEKTPWPSVAGLSAVPFSIVTIRGLPSSRVLLWQRQKVLIHRTETAAQI